MVGFIDAKNPIKKKERAMSSYDVGQQAEKNFPVLEESGGREGRLERTSNCSLVSKYPSVGATIFFHPLKTIRILDNTLSRLIHTL